MVTHLPLSKEQITLNRGIISNPTSDVGAFYAALRLLEELRYSVFDCRVAYYALRSAYRRSLRKAATLLYEPWEI